MFKTGSGTQAALRDGYEQTAQLVWDDCFPFDQALELAASLDKPLNRSRRLEWLWCPELLLRELGEPDIWTGDTSAHSMGSGVGLLFGSGPSLPSTVTRTRGRSAVAVVCAVGVTPSIYGL